MIDPKLWSQIQVTGITEADYERAVRHIDTINAMNNLTYNGIFIYDNFKMDHFYLTPNTFGRLGYKRSDVNNIGRIFIDTFITPEGQKAIWKAYADTTPIQRQISCNIQNNKKMCVNTNIYSI